MTMPTFASGHMFIFTVLSVSAPPSPSICLAAQAKRVGPNSFVQEALISAVTCTAYAGTDEFHQLFIPGRAGMIQDVGVDALGFLPCIAITFLVTAWLRHKAAKTQQ